MYTVVENGLDAVTFTLLRNKVQFKEYDLADIQEALKKSLYTVVVYDDTRPIGIARIVGDDRICFFLKDVVVDPDYQKLHVGDLIMKNIFSYINAHACEGAYVGLMSTPLCVPFYERYGFVQRPCKGMGPGMILFYSFQQGY